MAKRIEKNRLELYHRDASSPVIKLLYSNAVGAPAITILLGFQTSGDKSKLESLLVERLTTAGFSDVTPEEGRIPSQEREIRDLVTSKGRCLLQITADIPDPTFHGRRWQISQDREKVEELLASMRELHFISSDLIDPHHSRQRGQSGFTDEQRRRGDNRGWGRHNGRT